MSLEKMATMMDLFKDISGKLLLQTGGLHSSQRVEPSLGCPPPPQERCTYALLRSALPQSAVLLHCMSVFLQFNPLKLIRSHPPWELSSLGGEGGQGAGR